MTLLIKNGLVIDPANKINEKLDILVENKKIKKIAKNIDTKAEKIIDAKNLVVTPGLIDMHVHFREPGREDKETLETGSLAALAGGITSVVTMPNTTPVVDNQSVVEFIIKRTKELDLINIFPTGCISKNQHGEMLAEMWEMKNSGVVGVTDDGVDIQNEGLLLRAMEYAKTHNILFMSHCEIDNLKEDGAMHEGWVSTQLGLPGIPEETEDLAVFKNILLAQKTGVRLHLFHNSTKKSIDFIREAKQKGLKNITAEVTPHHFACTDEECLGFNTNAKINPPLRTEEHRQAIIKGLKDDTIDCISTDHAPHTVPEKISPFVDAPMGSIGLETCFGVMNTYLVEKKHMTLEHCLEKMTINPAKIIGIERGDLSLGTTADISIFDQNKEWIVDPKDNFSKGKNCVFNGKKLKGKALYTIVNGQVKFKK